MNPERIGVVSEGMTDQIILEVLLPKANRKLRDTKFIKIQPNHDRTSIGGGTEGGWTYVQIWCQNTDPALRRQLVLGDGLFETSGTASLGCDGFIIHMDADICEKPEFQKQSSVRSSDFDLNTPVGRGEYISAVLTDWLWPDEQPAAEDLSWTVLAPAVECTETWLVAALSREKEPESDKRIPETLLRACHAHPEIPTQAGQKEITKKRKPYENLARCAAKDVKKILKKCPHFRYLVNNVSNISK